MSKRKILCFATHYLPGYKYGGPLRSLLHMQEWLQDEYDFLVITRDRDLGDAVAYPGQATGEWCPVGSARVWYLAKPYWAPGRLLDALRGITPDLMYFQSAFDPALTIMPAVLRRLNVVKKTVPVLVAPRGEFSAGALALKSKKKQAYIWVAKRIGLYEGVTWHATVPAEADEITGIWGGASNVVLAPNLPGRNYAASMPVRQPKGAKSLRLVFLSRISRKKNLHGALALLMDVRANVSFDIYGTQEDPIYWAECARLMAKLPVNICATYRGPVSPTDVVTTLANYDVFLFPTLGENFGHVILEALLAGCPLLLSDRTPWRNLTARNVGFDIELGDWSKFRMAIEKLSAMDASEFDRWSKCARAWGESYCSSDDLVERTARMLNIAIHR